MFGPHPKAVNPIFNAFGWLSNVPVGSTLEVVVYERVQGEEAAFCHGKATIKPWESHGVEALSELHRTYGAWVDLVAKTKVSNDRGPISKITVAVSRPEGVFAAQVDPAPAMRFMPTAPGPADLPHTFHGVEGPASSLTIPSKWCRSLPS